MLITFYHYLKMLINRHLIEPPSENIYLVATKFIQDAASSGDLAELERVKLAFHASFVRFGWHNDFGKLFTDILSAISLRKEELTPEEIF